MQAFFCLSEIQKIGQDLDISKVFVHYYYCVFNIIRSDFIQNSLLITATIIVVYKFFC